MKNITLYVTLLFCGCVFAQPPAGYYDNAQGFSGYALKSALSQIITTSHNPQAYSTHWSFFEIADVLPNGKVWDIYANCEFTFGTPTNGGNQDVGTGGNTECEFFNREHTFPTSWFGNTEPLRSDVVQVLPVDKKVNNERGNLPYAMVGGIAFTSTNGSKRGTSITPGVTGQVFEVIDEYKGDIARIFFYIATRYETDIAAWQTFNPDGDKMLDGSSQRVFEQWALDLLYQWHLQDPVSDKEINRNNLTYNYQNNRNPFVDNPQWVQQIWGNSLSVTPSVFSEITVYPNPSRGAVTISGVDNVDNIQLINVNGQLMMQLKNPIISERQIELQQLPSGFYLLRLQHGSVTSTHKLVVQ
ncbi:MAG: endonuclease [Flavobacterium sp.]